MPRGAAFRARSEAASGPKFPSSPVCERTTPTPEVGNLRNWGWADDHYLSSAALGSISSVYARFPRPRVVA